jgi:hypothetical protein
MLKTSTNWSEALIIYGIHEYIAVFMDFGNIMGISRVSSNFYKVEMLTFSTIQDQLYRDSKVFLRVIPKVSQHF